MHSTCYAGRVRLVLRAPADIQQGPRHLCGALAALHAGWPGRGELQLAMIADANGTELQLAFPDALRPLVEAELYAAYPDAELLPLAETDPASVEQVHVDIANLRLWPDVFPLRVDESDGGRVHASAVDPLGGLLGLLPPERGITRTELLLRLRPARASALRKASRSLKECCQVGRRNVASFSSWFPARGLVRALSKLARLLRPAPSHSHETRSLRHMAEERLHDRLWEVTLQLTARGQRGETGRRIKQLIGALGPFVDPSLAHWRKVAPWRRVRFLLSSAEAAALWHPPGEHLRPPAFTPVASRELEPPLQLPTPKTHPHMSVLGEAVFRGRAQRCGLLPDDKRRHLLLLGKTGMGKSTLLHSLAISEIAAGRGICLIDPHGDLCDTVERSLPRRRTNDVIIFDAADAQHSIGFNPLACADPAQRPLVASAVLSAFKKLYAEFFGPRMEHIWRHTLLTALELPRPTLFHLPRLLTDSRFREQALRKISDPLLRAFWEREFAPMHPKLQAEAISPILNKVGQFLAQPVIRAIVGQSESRLNLRAVLDEGRVLLVNLSKGRIGDDASALLGSFLISGLQLAAMSRADLPEEQRSDFTLFVDELGSFATESFANLLSEARKYRVALVGAAQYLTQLSPATQAAVWGNIGSLLAFQLGVDDAPTVASQLGADARPDDLLMLPRYQAYARLLIDGQPSRPFSLRTLLPARLPLDPRRSEIVRRASHRRYARPRAMVEQELRRSLTAN